MIYPATTSELLAAIWRALPTDHRDGEYAFKELCARIGYVPDMLVYNPRWLEGHDHPTEHP